MAGASAGVRPAQRPMKKLQSPNRNNAYSKATRSGGGMSPRQCIPPDCGQLQPGAGDSGAVAPAGRGRGGGGGAGAGVVAGVGQQRPVAAGRGAGRVLPAWMTAPGSGGGHADAKAAAGAQHVPGQFDDAPAGKGTAKGGAGGKGGGGAHRKTRRGTKGKAAASQGARETAAKRTKERQR